MSDRKGLINNGIHDSRLCLPPKGRSSYYQADERSVMVECARVDGASVWDLVGPGSCVYWPCSAIHNPDINIFCELVFLFIASMLATPRLLETFSIGPQ